MRKSVKKKVKFLLSKIKLYMTTHDQIMVSRRQNTSLRLIKSHTLFRLGKEAKSFWPADSKSMSWGDFGNFSSCNEIHKLCIEPFSTIKTIIVLKVNELNTSSMGDEVFIFSEKWDKPVVRSSTLDKTLQVTKKQKKKDIQLLRNWECTLTLLKTSAATVENNIALVSITPPNDWYINSPFHPNQSTNHDLVSRVFLSF